LILPFSLSLSKKKRGKKKTRKNGGKGARREIPIPIPIPMLIPSECDACQVKGREFKTRIPPSFHRY
jgi:hypothetical protein